MPEVSRGTALCFIKASFCAFFFFFEIVFIVNSITVALPRQLGRIFVVQEIFEIHMIEVHCSPSHPP